MIQLSTVNQQLAQGGQPSSIVLTAVIDTALCVGAGGSSGSLADKPILKTADGHLVIPASQLKGRLRHECEKLTRALGWPTCVSPVATTMCTQRLGLVESEFKREDDYFVPLFIGGSKEETKQNPYNYHCLICQLFGNPSLPARLQFSDLVCITPPEDIPEVLRPGVSINRRRRTAEEKKLYFLETSPVNAALEFSGVLTLNPALVQNRTDFAKALILAGLRHIHALGGGKSTGLGWLHWQSTAFDHPDIDQAIWDFLSKKKPNQAAAQPSETAEESA
jgi:CRISPR/Cas system CSM-associated protein Csm3 (group 7 of RAMP superfamily)